MGSACADLACRGDDRSSWVCPSCMHCCSWGMLDAGLACARACTAAYRRPPPPPPPAAAAAAYPPPPATTPRHFCRPAPQVFNLTTYPHLVGLFSELGVETQPSEMSFALSMDGGALEWGSHGLDAVFAQRGNLASPAFLGMLRDVLRFGRQAPEVLRPENRGEFGGMTLGQYLELRRYGTAFRENYVVPMCAAVWSVPSAQVRGARPRRSAAQRSAGSGAQADRLHLLAANPTCALLTSAALPACLPARPSLPSCLPACAGP